MPLLGQPVGSVTPTAYNGPLMTYLVGVAFALFGAEPLYAAALVAICNTAGIIVTFMLGRRLYSPLVGLIAAALMSVAPWLVLYSRMLWPQALYLCLVPVILYVLLAAIEDDKAWLHLLLGVLLGIGMQLHLSMLVLIGVSIVVVLAYGRRKALLVMLGLGFLIGYAPILIYDATHNFANLGVLVRLPSLHKLNAAAGESESRVQHIAKVLWNFSNILSGQGLWVSKLSRQSFLPPALDWGQGLIGTTLFAVAFATMVVANVKGKPFIQAIRFPHQDAIVLLAALTQLAYMLVSSSPVQRHYYIFLYPAVFLVMARGLTLLQTAIARRKPGAGLQWVVPTALILLFALNLTTILYARSFLIRTGGQGEYGTVLEDKIAAVRAIHAETGKAFEVDLTNVQEPLPYIFLLERQVPLTFEGAPEYAAQVAYAPTAPTSGSRQRYQIIEPEYAKSPAFDSGRIIFQSRGVVVLALPE